ncbi:MAG: hypothetical protein ACM3MM_00570 [Acidobacteriota bacterium]
MRRPAGRSTVVAASLGLLLSACFTTTADFRSDAETFIVENEELRTALFPDSDTAFVSATCTEPPDRDEGTTFPCTATDSNDDTWEFEIVITGSNEYEVNLSRAPDGG